MRYVKLSFLVVAACLVVGCGSGSEDGAGPIGPGPIPSILADVGQEQVTTVGEILANPTQFVGQRVQLSGGEKKLLAIAENEKTNARLENEGFEVSTYPGSEISLNGSGGPTCLTRPLLRS